MDTELLKTFLEVTKTRHFGRAADNLFLTQSAVSFRIRQLETQLGNDLFSRQRGNVHLTPAGERLQPYAEAILQTWGRAKQDVALTEALNQQVTIGASALIWEFDGIADWISRIYQSVDGLALRLESMPRQSLVKQLFDKTIDVAITSEPPKIESLHVAKVRDYQLQLVTREQGCGLEDLKNKPLVYLDWGTRFSMEQSRISELQKTPIMHTHSSKMALEFLINHDSTGFLPAPVVAQSVVEGVLYTVDNAPVIEQSLYMVWREDSEKYEMLESLLAVPFNQVVESI
ncbi:transcriptional regulator [Photobacterium aquae]|uniref:Transcriptional regulator n=1 Tax=Photobacterium aquae TaxID=1195763 RepID=A0A0J1GWR9_9GAMM|nr:HTH-type transcriptional regulator HdfR [Photobacterium aquae]KLV04056.1 transcriptional regulator [Photobacterium aquae]